MEEKHGMTAVFCVSVEEGSTHFPLLLFDPASAFTLPPLWPASSCSFHAPFSYLCQLVQKILRYITNFAFSCWFFLVLNCTSEKCTWKRRSWFLNAQRSGCDILNIYRFLCSWLYCAFSCITANSVYFCKLSGIVFWTDFVTRRL